MRRACRHVSESVHSNPREDPPCCSSARGAVGTLIDLSAVPAIGGLKLARAALSALLPIGSGDRAPDCAQCGAPVRDGDPFLRYHGEYYHAHGCAEEHPPADRRRRALTAETTI
jgi:hypothetical protein